MDYFSSCSCEAVRVKLSLPRSIESYQPRECDCDFCKHHSLAYISDPLGKLSVNSSASVNFLKQGSEQASFIQCSRCNQVVAVFYDAEKVKKGAVSATLFANRHSFNEYQTTSPKLLSSANRRERWGNLWLTVVLEISENT